MDSSLGLHERLWAVKYIIFLGLFGVTLASIEQAERLAEVEPFKTAIVLKFARAWPFTLYALVLLGIGLFVERFYCRYLCPLGAALLVALAGALKTKPEHIMEARRTLSPSEFE